jgi:hypothetical protein
LNCQINDEKSLNIFQNKTGRNPIIKLENKTKRSIFLISLRLKYKYEIINARIAIYELYFVFMNKIVGSAVIRTFFSLKITKCHVMRFIIKRNNIKESGKEKMPVIIMNGEKMNKTNLNRLDKVLLFNLQKVKTRKHVPKFINKFRILIPSSEDPNRLFEIKITSAIPIGWS